jgi:hypothetical protein
MLPVTSAIRDIQSELEVTRTPDPRLHDMLRATHFIQGYTTLFRSRALLEIHNQNLK